MRLFTDSEATLESIASSKQIERKTLRLTLVNLKERLVDREIYSYFWLPTQSMWADVILKNVFDLPKTLVNEVKAVGTQKRMSNIWNR